MNVKDLQQHIVVVGAGAWGTAIALLLERCGSRVTLWSRNREVVDDVLIKRENTVYLPGIRIPDAVQITSNPAIVHEAQFVFIVVPAQQCRNALNEISPFIRKVPLVVASKGIEQESLMMMNQVVGSVLPTHRVAILSGPNFADEVASGLPAASTLACEDMDLTKELGFLLQCSHFRPYLSDDVIGAQMGGSLKNVLAIASGIVQGRGLGENAKAALITRGLAEIRRFAKVMGGREETVMGLSGLGDVILTCSSMKSRNMSLGFSLGQGEVLDIILSRRHHVTEGVTSALSLHKLAKQLGVDMPICEAVHDILYEKADIGRTIRCLLERPLVEE